MISVLDVVSILPHDLITWISVDDDDVVPKINIHIHTHTYTHNQT